MAYEGEILNAGGSLDIDLSRATIVAVSGSGPNVCGHLILYVEGGAGGFYFHVAGLHDFPRYMTDAGFQRYLSDNDKIVLRRLPVSIPNPNAARAKLESLLSEKWTWGVLPHNCVSFVEEVIAAGGGTWASASNCPAAATAPSLTHQVNDFLNRLESEIYRQYGVPRF